MADVGVCNHRGCYGRCPTSTICVRLSCPPTCDCCPCPGKIKDFISQLAEDCYYFKHFFNLIRTTPRMPNKPSQQPKGKASKMRGKKGKGGDGQVGEKIEHDKTGGLFDNLDDDGDGDGTGGGSSRKQKPSKEARLKNKLDALFDDALVNGLLVGGGGKGRKGKHSAAYYKKLNISVACIQDCEPLCCDD